MGASRFVPEQCRANPHINTACSMKLSGHGVLARYCLQSRHLVVGVDVGGLPRVADPDVTDGSGGEVSGHLNLLGEAALLLLVLVLVVRAVRSDVGQRQA